MTLKNILDGVSFDVVGALPLEKDITGIVCDSRQVEQDFVFVAHRGKLLNGEDYIDSAIRRGAVVVVVQKREAAERSAIEQAGVVTLYVDDTREVIALMAANFYHHPAKELQMIGVTASNGKTSTTFLLDSIYRAAGIPNGVIGTVYARTGKSNVPSILTTPDSADLHRYFREMVDSGYKACIMEVSSISIAMKRVYGISYDIFAFNNISREHIDDHGDFETYYGLKASIPESMDSEHMVVLNQDDPLVYEVKDRTKAVVRTFSAKGEGIRGAETAKVENEGVNTTVPSCFIRSLDLRTGRGMFTLVFADGEVRRELPVSLVVSGYHNVVNALSAATIAHAAGIRAEAIKQGLETYHGVERRFECIYEGAFKLYDDHFANPGNIDVTFETMHQMDFRRLVLCYAVRGSRGTTVNGENAEVMCGHLKRLGVTEIIATASEETVTSKDMLQDDEKDIFFEIVEREGIAVEWHQKLVPAVCSAIDQLEDGDVLLLAGCQGMDSGAHIALNYLAEKKGDSSILAPLKQRVCGFLPE